MKTPDEPNAPDLRELLQTWTAPAPRDDFEAVVRARLRKPAGQPATALWNWRERLIPRLAWATAGQVALAAAVALMVARQAPTHASRPSPADVFASRETDTITHAYWHLLKETP